MNKNKTKEEEQLLRELNSVSIIVELNNGEVNVMTSGNPNSFIIVNKNAKEIALKKIRDPFMNIPSFIKGQMDKWSQPPKKK